MISPREKTVAWYCFLVKCDYIDSEANIGFFRVSLIACAHSEKLLPTDIWRIGKPIVL